MQKGFTHICNECDSKNTGIDKELEYDFDDNPKTVSYIVCYDCHQKLKIL